MKKPILRKRISRKPLVRKSKRAATRRVKVISQKKAGSTPEHEATFRHIVESVTDYAIFMLDSKGVISSWNQGAQRLKGYKANEIIGKPFAVFYPKKDARAGKPLKELKMAKRHGRFEDSGWRVRKDGNLFWATVTITAVRDKAGQLQGFVKVTRDDTKRKQTEDALRISQAELAEGQRIAHLGSWNWNILTNELLWTEEIYRIYGLKRKSTSLSYEVFQKMLHPDDRSRIEKAISDSLKHDHPYHVEFRIVRAGGEVRHVFGRGEVFRDAKGKPLRMAGSVIDITEVRRSQAALHVSEEQFSSAFGNATIGMAIVAPDGKWIKVNRALCDLTGYPEKELTQKTFQDITHPDDLEDDLKNLRKLLGGKIESYHIEKRYFHKRGHIVWVLLGVTLVRDADGKPLHFVSQIQDITQRRQSEVNLRDAMERMQLAARTAKVGIWEMDYTTDKLDWDEQMYALYGLKPENAEPDCRRRWSQVLHPEDVGRVFQEADAALQGGKPFNTQFRIIRANDKCIRFIRAIATTQRDKNGNVTRMIGTNLDITEEYEREVYLANALEHEKELARAAQEGERAKSEFLAVMSHEIRTPMNGIIGYSELLSHAPNLAEDYKEYVDIINRSGETLLRILDDILDFSRLEAGRLQIEKAHFSPREVINDVSALLSPRAHDKGLAIHICIDDTVPDHVLGDSIRVRQILLNLVGNAIKFTDQGSVTLLLRRSQANASKGAVSLDFIVKDTGLGVSPQTQKRIFEPFVQEHSGITRKYGGSGLGLTITQHLTDLMGGELRLVSHVEKGSEFFVTLPFEIGKEAKKAVDHVIHDPFDQNFAIRYPLRILVVEDDKINLKLIITFLNKLGYQPLAAQNGLKALEIYRKESPECILMDMQMPEMDGITATQEIRKLENLANPKSHSFISALTANIFPSVQRQCIAAGMDFFLNKPLKHEKLAQTLIKAREMTRR